MKIAFLVFVCLIVSPFAFGDDDHEKSPKSSGNSSPNASIEACLEHWGTHPFGKHPKFRKMSTSVKVFGIGSNPIDDDITDKPALILVSPSVNVMGGSTIQLLNPQGWYCLRTNVNVMGGLKIKANCKAHLASATDGATVLGKSDKDENHGVTVLGATHVELVGCGKDSKESD